TSPNVDTANPSPASMRARRSMRPSPPATNSFLSKKTASRRCMILHPMREAKRGCALERVRDGIGKRLLLTAEVHFQRLALKQLDQRLARLYADADDAAAVVELEGIALPGGGQKRRQAEAVGGAHAREA